jgi:hypothetical protein
MKPLLKWSAPQQGLADKGRWVLGEPRPMIHRSHFLHFFLRLQLSEGACQQRCPCRAIHSQDHGLAVEDEMLLLVLQRSFSDPLRNLLMGYDLKVEVTGQAARVALINPIIGDPKPLVEPVGDINGDSAPAQLVVIPSGLG